MLVTFLQLTLITKIQTSYLLRKPFSKFFSQSLLYICSWNFMTLWSLLNEISKFTTLNDNNKCQSYKLYSILELLQKKCFTQISWTTSPKILRTPLIQLGGVEAVLQTARCSRTSWWTPATARRIVRGSWRKLTSEGFVSMVDEGEGGGGMNVGCAIYSGIPSNGA